MAFLSILEMYNERPDIFDNFVLPTAADISDDAPKIDDPFVPDKTTLTEFIMMELAEVSLVYIDPDVIKKMIQIWSKVRVSTWIALYNTLIYDYNPIWNKDGYYQETRNLSGTNNETRNLSVTDNYTVTNMKTDHTGSVTHNVTGFDTNSLLPESSDVPNTSDTTNGATGNSRTDTGTDNRTTSDTGTITRVENGNIGVTTTQKMIEEQRELVKFNLYETIAEEFKERFCVMLY